MRTTSTASQILALSTISRRPMPTAANDNRPRRRMTPAMLDALLEASGIDLRRTRAIQGA